MDRETIDELANGLHVLEPRDQFDPCIVGIVERFNDTFVLYDRKCVLESIAAGIMEGFELDEDPEDFDSHPDQEALEHYEFNIRGGWIGDDTPGFLVRPEE